MGAWLATLCVGLVLVFAAASAASVVDRLQHGNELPHDHGVQQADAHDHAHQDSPDGHGDTSEKGEHQPGLGHHHSDAPRAGLCGPQPPWKRRAQPCSQLTWRTCSASKV